MDLNTQVELIEQIKSTYLKNGFQHISEIYMSSLANPTFYSDY
jgi:23S rRNA A1618 N6-methylase RlmF